MVDVAAYAEQARQQAAAQQAALLSWAQSPAGQKQYEERVAIARTGAPVVPVATVAPSYSSTTKGPAPTLGVWDTIASAFSGSRPSAPGPTTAPVAPVLQVQPLLGQNTSLAGREAALAQEADDGPGFLDQLGAGLSKALGNVQLSLGGGQPIRIETTAGQASSGGLDTTGMVLLGGAAVVVVLLVVWK